MSAGQHDPQTQARPTYTQVFATQGMARLYTSMILGRTAGQMWEVVLVLFVLQRFHSPGLAGITVFLSVFPGLLVSPLAGALLDRHGRVRLIIVDYTVFAISVGAIVALSFTGHLTAAVLMPLVTASSLTGMLSASGVRSMIPLILPRHLWDRGNAIDSTGYTVTAIVGPALAGLMTGFFGGEVALLTTAVIFMVAALTLVGLREPVVAATHAPLLRSAVAALAYVVRNPSLRGLALALSAQNLGWGMVLIAVPVVVLQHLHGTPAQVGALWALQGALGVVGGLVFGRISSEGRERQVLAVCLAASVFSLLVMSTMTAAGLIVGVMLTGLAIGPEDVTMFSMRQRRTDVAWFGRAFAVSMSLNYAGTPLGSALAGPVIAASLPGTFVLAAACCAVAAVLALAAVPREG
jgi:MFS family permease